MNTPTGKDNRMKKTITIAALIAALMLTGCSGGNSTTESSTSSGSQASGTAEATLTTAAQKADAVLADITFAGEMTALTDDTMQFNLGFDTEGLTDYAAYLCGSGAYPDEFGIFTAETQEKADEIKAALDKHIESKKETFADYTPDEMYKFDDCFVKQNGTTVYFAVTADNTKAADILG